MRADKKQKSLKAFLPNYAQELLLKAALWQNDDAVACWKEHLTLVPFDDTDYGSSRLLTMVYRNLNSLGYDDPYMARMKGIYRRTWAENQKNFQHLPQVLEAFRQAKIPALLLKGAALILLCYRDFGLRGMGDFDIAVPATRVQEAISILEKMQWRPFLEYPTLQLEAHHAVHMMNPKGEDLDLHWHILVHRCEDEYDLPFWEGARPLNYKGMELLSPQPSDHLVHACLHGAAWSAISPLRWVADGYFLIKKCEIDWERVLEMGRLLGVLPALRATLGYLQEHFSAGVPQDFLARLDAIESPDWQRRELEVLCRPHGFFGMLPLLWSRHSQERMRGRPSRRLWNFPSYLRKFYGAEGYRDLGALFINKGWKKLNSRLRSKAKALPKTPSKSAPFPT